MQISENCPCKKENCSRHGDCTECRIHHANSKRRQPVACERDIPKAKQKQTKVRLSTVISSLSLIFVIGGIFGFIYEVIFYRFDLGYFVKRGTTLGPWIPIYGFGTLFITLITYKLRKHWWLVMLTGGAISGILEFTTGYLLFHIRGIRLWDYNIEILNAGNIGGYVCIRSVAVFAGASLFLIYFIVPFVRKLQDKIPDKVFSIISLLLGALFFIDFAGANIFHLY